MPAKMKYFKGIVKRVMSGDTFVVLGPNGENGLPQEKRLSIYAIRAPFKVDEGKTDPWKFEAKENLRKLIAGHTIKFSSFSIDNRSFAHVLLEDGTDLGLKLLQDGWAYLSRKLDPKISPPKFNEYEPAFQNAKSD